MRSGLSRRHRAILRCLFAQAATSLEKGSSSSSEASAHLWVLLALEIRLSIVSKLHVTRGPWISERHLRPTNLCHTRIRFRIMPSQVKIMRSEGPVGLYRGDLGLRPQLVLQIHKSLGCISVVRVEVGMTGTLRRFSTNSSGSRVALTKSSKTLAVA